MMTHAERQRITFDSWLDDSQRLRDLVTEANRTYRRLCNIGLTNEYDQGRIMDAILLAGNRQARRAEALRLFTYRYAR